MFLGLIKGQKKMGGAGLGGFFGGVGGGFLFGGPRGDTDFER